MTTLRVKIAIVLYGAFVLSHFRYAQVLLGPDRRQLPCRHQNIIWEAKISSGNVLRWLLLAKCAHSGSVDAGWLVTPILVHYVRCRATV